MKTKKPKPAPAPDPIAARELDTILAALRYWQHNNSNDISPFCRQLDEMASEHGPALDAEEIDSLCERLNLGAVALSALELGAIASANLLAAAREALAILDHLVPQPRTLQTAARYGGTTYTAISDLRQAIDQAQPKPTPKLPKRLRVKPEPTYKPNPHLPEKKPKNKPKRTRPTVSPAILDPFAKGGLGGVRFGKKGRN